MCRNWQTKNEMKLCTNGQYKWQQHDIFKSEIVIVFNNIR